jgi:hypothetical protein
MAAELTRDLASFMLVQGIGTALATDVFLEGMPPHPTGVAVSYCLTDTGGFPATSGIPDLRRTVQVMVRAKGPDVAKAAAWAVYGLFFPEGRGRHIVGSGKTYLTVPTASALPSPIGEDDGGRDRYTFNMVVTTTPGL